MEQPDWFYECFCLIRSEEIVHQNWLNEQAERKAAIETAKGKLEAQRGRGRY
jgi:hypothetical protein